MTILDSLTPQIANNSFVTLTCAQPHCVTPPLRVHMHQGHLLFENAAAGGHLRCRRDQEGLAPCDEPRTYFVRNEWVR